MSDLLLQELLAVAQQILDRGRPLLEQRGLGATIVVHTSTLVAGEYPKAVVTTLPSRAHQRAMLADALVAMTLADGVEPDKIADLVAADLAALEEPKP